LRKETKIKEKASRMPDLSEAKVCRRVQDGLKEIEAQNSETARSHAFSALLRDLFAQLEVHFIEDYFKGLEKYVSRRQADLVIRGRIDAFFGNLIIEFESEMPKKLEEAKEQLKKYVAVVALDPQKKDVRFLAVATDGVRFHVFAPKPHPEPTEVVLKEVESIDLLKDVEPYHAFLWLDRYFMRRRTLTPKSADFARDFGVNSPAFLQSSVILEEAWQDADCRTEYAVVFESWHKYLRITYGGAVGDEELFLRHTYLATLAKLMIWMRLSGKSAPPSDAETLEILEGDYFKDKGLSNFLEEDFFSWLGRKEARDYSLDMCRKLINQLAKYNLKELSEDVMKGLYQELVDPEARHDLGEYYTPDWLAHRMVKRLVDSNPEASVLDPACGSGTFLYQAIKEKRRLLGNYAKTLRHICENVQGIDIHPLAVIIAKTNYLLALGDLAKKRKTNLHIPIYLADSIKPPEETIQRGELAAELRGFQFEVDGEKVFVPQGVAKEPDIYNETLDLCTSFAKANVGKDVTREAFAEFSVNQGWVFAYDNAYIESMFQLSHTLKTLIERKRDTIWAYILKNYFRPIFMQRRFDIVVGNPPWLSYRYVDKGKYQQFLKEEITKTYELLKGRGELLTHMELATLFHVKCAHMYLKQRDGIVAFVLPRSVFVSDQHDNFRRGYLGFTLKHTEVWDLEKVSPLFNVPACVFFSRTGYAGGSAERIEYQAEVLSGELRVKNSSLAEAEKLLSVTRERLRLSERGKRSYLSASRHVASTAASPYLADFKQGATIVPRPFWFVSPRPLPDVGINPHKPYLESAEDARRRTKKQYKGVFFKGKVESEFLYGTLLSTDIVPFGFTALRPVVLPIVPRMHEYGMLSATEAHKAGYYDLEKWLKKAEKEWKARRAEKAKRMSIHERLNYNALLASQNPQAKYRVLYTASATYIAACIVPKRAFKLEVDGQRIALAGFVAESKTYRFETDNSSEAHFLSAVLNSSITDLLLKPMQSRGLFGPRDIHKKVLELPIPRFKAADKSHKELVRLGKLCSKRVQNFLRGYAGSLAIGRLRRKVRDLLAAELAEIDSIVKVILGEVP